MLTLYGIPNCGTVKKARAWLEARDVPYTFVNFRKEPPTAAAVEKWVEAVGSKPLRNTSGGSYRALGAEKKTWSDEQWASAFASDPMLIKRPVIERDGALLKVGFRGADDEIAAQIL